MTIGQALKKIERDVASVSDSPALEARWLLSHVLQKSEHELVTTSEQDLSASHAARLEKYIQERKTGKPLAYSLGEWEFYGRAFFVTQDVLVPRPATEHLIEKALSVITAMSSQKGRALTVADVGTGSGIIAITLTLESPSIQQIIATDISPAALVVAKTNALRHGVQNIIEFLEGDFLNPIMDKQIDLIVSNPPYVPSQELTASPTKDTLGLQFEPRQALDGGSDGLHYIRLLETSGLPVVAESLHGDIVSFHLPSF